MFGNIVLFGWPVVVKILLDNKALPTAILISIIAGYLLLPEQLVLDLPLFPDFDKHTIPVVAVFFFVLLMGGRYGTKTLAGWLPKGVIAKSFVLLLTVGAFFTVMTNGDPQVFGPTYLQALRPIDAFSILVVVVTTILPLLLARKFLAYPEHHTTFLFILIVAGALYSFLALYEVRMSPQLSNMVYGFFPHSWLQHIRGNGYRPIVFLEHGLWVSMFFACTVLAAAGYTRIAETKQRMMYVGLGLWLLMTLIFSKSLGALVITLVLLPVVLLFKPRMQFLVCAIFAFIVLLYPALRGAGVIPVDRVLEWAEGVSAERAWSLQFRIDNEDALLARAQLRPVFGWGGWGRGHIFDEYGRNISTFDGYWIVIVSLGGWVRYLGELGLLCMPIIFAVFSSRKGQYGLETSALAIVLTANLIDLLPNATISPITWMLAGALWGRLELGQISEDDKTTASKDNRRQKIAYTRFAHSIKASRPHLGQAHVTADHKIKPAPRYSRFTPEE